LKGDGIEMKINNKDWAAWASLIFKDPEPMWSSNEADEKAAATLPVSKTKGLTS
jgi:hypothetical protein